MVQIHDLFARAGAMALASVFAFSAFAGLEQDFAEAVKSGRPLSAEAAYLKLTKEGAKLPASVHLQAAEIARTLGKTTARNDRAMLYLRLEKGWNATVERELWRLCKSGSDAELFARLAANAKPDRTLWLVGRDLVTRLAAAKRSAELLKVADILIARFPEKNRRAFVLNALYECSRDCTATYPRAELAALVMRHAGLADCGGMWELLNYGNQRDAFPPDFMMRYVDRHGGDFGEDLLYNSMGCLDSDAVRDLEDAAKLRERDERAAVLKRLEPVLLSGRHPRLALRYFRIAGRTVPTMIAPGWKKGTPVAGLAALYAKLVAQPAYKSDRAYRGEVHQQRNEFISWRRFTPQETAAIVDAEPDTVGIGNIVADSSLGNIDQAIQKAGSLAPIAEFKKRFPSRADEIDDNRYRSYSQSNRYAGDAAAVKRIFTRAYRNNRTFGIWYVDGIAQECNSMPFAEKLALLKEAYAFTGFNDAWKEFKRRAESAKDKQGFYGEPAVKAFGREIGEGALPGDPFFRLSVLAQRAKTAAEMSALAPEFAKLYPSKYGEAASKRDNALAAAYVERFRSVAWTDKPEDAKRYLECVLPKYSAKGPDMWLDSYLGKANDAKLWADYCRAALAAGRTVDELSGIGVAWGAERDPYPELDVGKMKPGNARKYAQRLWERMKEGPARYEALYRYLASRPYAEQAPEGINWAMKTLADVRAKDAHAKFPLDAALRQVYGGDDPYRFDMEAYLNLLKIAARMGRAGDARPRYCAWAERLDPIDRATAYGWLVDASVLKVGADGKGDRWEPVLDAKDRRELAVGAFLKAVKALPDARLPLCTIGFSRFGELRDWREELAKAKADDPAIAAIDGFYDTVTAKMLGGAGVAGGEMCMAWHRRLDLALAAKDAVAAAKVARRAAGSIIGHWLGGEAYFKRLFENFRALGNDEPCYLYVDAVRSDQQGWIVAMAAKRRAEIASSLPGVYPVGENDPAYPLYVAADELARKNPERAWQILQDPRHQTVFEREALKLPPEFVIWGVEQLRMARGDRDKLLVKARQIATAILAQESQVPAEVAAAMVFSRAEGYRDQRNFEAAKLEYQSVRDNPAYHATKYGRRAMFRAMDLQIATGNTQGVESTLEYWLSQNDREVQAEAHYFLAKLAFDRKDYDECVKQLRQVFAINYTHTEGRFLQGQWKLATNSEVDDTDVLVGDLSERNLIRPGNQLTVTVQDANLSVAGGGASIPVVVRSEPGGDVERINLYPTSRDPSNFKGLVEVRLGRACPSNRVLEVVGSDRVSYVIDPGFLRERGLPPNRPKVLRVIDDAKLVMGAGAPRTEERKTEKGLKDLLDDDRNLEDSGVSKKLRPGNPLYVVVQDRDRSLGGDSDRVRVTIETSSGDRLANCELAEEKPFTGVFRGKIETSLPPPRAFASDTAAGLNPGDVINRNRETGWKSLADGQPGKWFEVDTMGSHLFSEIALETPGADDIKAIKLVGRMGSRDLQLGCLPVAAEATRLGLALQQQYYRNPPRSLNAQRAYCRTDRAAKRKAVDRIEQRALGNGNDWQLSFFQGPCFIPDGVDSLRFRLSPKSTRREALRNLWIAFAVDGEEVFSGQGHKLRNALVTADVTSGCHQLELAVATFNHEDDFDFLWEPVGGEPQPVPADWFDADRHAELKGFVRDRARIERTATGFRAVFEKPVRLRSFRWEFADVKSPGVAVSRISAKDDRGGEVLPVESDFSDSQSNDTLEVAPGDRITVRYEDELTTSGEKKVLQRDMSSSFNDAKVRFIFEDVDVRGAVNAYDAFRFQPGDSLVLSVQDPDCDVSDGADEVVVTVRNSAGETFRKRLVECQPRWTYPGREEETYGMHSGVFMGVLKTCPESNTNAPAKVLRVKSDDLLTVEYEDRENTDPGVPCARTVRIFAARHAEPLLTLFDVRKVREIDNSSDARVKLERIRRRPGNENVHAVYRDVLVAEPMAAAALADTNPIPVNVAAGVIPVRVNDRSRARYACSKVSVVASARSEVERAAAEGRDPEQVTVPLKLAGSIAPVGLAKGGESQREAQTAGTFAGVVRLSLGPADPNLEVSDEAPPLCVSGSDVIDLAVVSEDGEPVLKRTLRLVSDATLTLADSTFSAERDSAHVGESFFVMVDDADRDESDEPDRITVVARSLQTGVSRPLTLTETMPHSGVFTGRLRPVMFAPGEAVPNVATGGVASAEEILTEDRFAVGYGDRVVFGYRDERTLPGTPARELSATGTVFRGSSGDVRLFSKRFTDRDAAVLVQFRLAECLFEQAKEHRNLKQSAKSAAAIDEGKFILEEALKNYPDSSHVVQGEFLLANLYQELASEQAEAGDEAKATPLYQEALSRFSQILGTWPEGEYAARSQYHKAYCLEMMKDYGRASEEYVKMTYLYPESELVGEASVRLANYYFTKEKRYDIAGHIYRNFQQRFPQHAQAMSTLFLAGSCYIKEAESIAEEVERRRERKEKLPPGYGARIDTAYRDAVKTFDMLVDVYRDGNPMMRAQTLYWAGDVCVRRRDYTKAYQYLKRAVFEFPETEWARRARGLLLQEGNNFKDFE